MKPVNWSLDWKGCLINAFIVIPSFFSNNFAQRRAGKISPFLERPLSTFYKKAVFFFCAKIFGHVNVASIILVILGMFIC